jgi:hypothetical protein
MSAPPDNAWDQLELEEREALIQKLFDSSADGDEAVLEAAGDYPKGVVRLGAYFGRATGEQP